MKDIINKINSNNLRTATDYVALFRELQTMIDDSEVLQNKRGKIAFLASFTALGMKEILFVKCCQAGIVPEIYVADYNQYHQDILNKNSELYDFGADLTIVFIDLRSLLGDHYFFPYATSVSERQAWAEEKISNCVNLIDRLKNNSHGKILFHNFEIPSYSPLGIAESKQEFGFWEAVETINRALRDRYKSDSQVYIFDFESWTARVGKQHILDNKLYYLADLKIALSHLPSLGDEYLAYIKSLLFGPKKCIVLDLDNTLWGGVVGEVGLEGIRIGPTPEGRSFWEFQKHLLALFERGVILAINSRNNFSDAIEVLREHPEMVLKEEHFASIQINWNDKASNLRAIAKELNLGLDALVFFDDDEYNRELVKNELPEVSTIDLPADTALYVPTLLGLNDFNSWQITPEDKNKGQMYVEQRKRNEFQLASLDLSEYLTGLQMEVEIDTINRMNIPRLAQLTQKTNQFNMTSRRYSEEDLRRFCSSDYLVVSLRLKDKFGDNGLIGLAIVEKSDKIWRLDCFLLSCRVIGRKVEETLLAFVVQQAQQVGVIQLVGEFVPTKKNNPARDFYKNSGFKLEKITTAGVERWIYDVGKNYPYPECIKVNIYKEYEKT